VYAFQLPKVWPTFMSCGKVSLYGKSLQKTADIGRERAFQVGSAKCRNQCARIEDA
jgi:hypothetical protein